ncbi:MAG: hypothetical protein K0R29_1899 [Pseudobdellovibrio sp.]|jgi:oxygen-dependent protoporphyrinogen oxidase|nr:hypothetical protein [Pseudobdellovibrio sp.]
MTQKKVAILGAGFSGLTLAWALTKKNISVEIFEAGAREGGMLGSKFDGVLIEQAANALLASENVETLLNDIGVKPVTAGFRSKKRWIYRDHPQKLPLRLSELLSGALSFLRAKISNNLQPLPNETLAAWAVRVFNPAIRDYLISPAFQGVYGTKADALSASLILKPLFEKSLRSKKGSLNGSISAESGMQEIIDGLARYLTERGVIINKNVGITVAELTKSHSAVVVATSLENAKYALKETAPIVSEQMSSVPMLPLATVTLKFSSTSRVQGFGCLFPAPENFHALGVLFNSDIFPGRGDYSETWIISDVKSTDDNLLRAIAIDRKRMAGAEENPVAHHIRRWEKALPLYGKELEKVLVNAPFSQGLISGVRLDESRSPLYLTGNYLGVIGLAKILDYNIRLSQRIEREIA